MDIVDDRYYLRQVDLKKPLRWKGVVTVELHSNPIQGNEPWGIRQVDIRFNDFEVGFEMLMPTMDVVTVADDELRQVDFWMILQRTEIIISNLIRKYAKVTIELSDDDTRVSITLEVSHRDRRGRERTWSTSALVPLEDLENFIIVRTDESEKL